MFIAALFIFAKIRMQPKCPSVQMDKEDVVYLQDTGVGD